MLRQLTSSILLSALFLTTISQSALAAHPESPHTGRNVDAPNNARNNNTSKSKEQAATAFTRLPIKFEANQGQSDDKDVNFIARNVAAGYSVLLKPAEAAFVFSNNQNKLPTQQPRQRLAQPRRQQLQQSAVLRMKLSGANKKTAIEARGLEPQAGKINYLRGNEREKWQTGVETFGRIEYHNVYQGIDLQYYSQPSKSLPPEQRSQLEQLEYDFIVSPQADYKQIRLCFDGASKVEIERGSGDLLLTTKAGILRQHRPVVYQESEKGDGKEERTTIESRYIRLSKNEVGFAVGEYDKTRQLIIDPVLNFSTYLGGGGEDYAAGIAVDSIGNIYITGETRSANFPTRNPLQPASGGGYQDRPFDAFITKINASGQLVYSTYLGGSDNDSSKGIAVDSAGNVCLIGTTSSTNFPTSNPFQPANSGGFGDAFVAKLNATGQQLIYSTYLGGSDGDSGNAIAVDLTGNVYVAGTTSSINFPTINALQPIYAGGDAFVTKISASGQLIYSTYLGGSSSDGVHSIAVDSASNVYVTGETLSTDFPTINAFQPNYAGGSAFVGDAFVSKISANGQQLVYSTYLGGSDYDAGNSIAVDSASNVYVAGTTSSINFPTSNALQPTYGGGYYDAFVSKISASGQQLIYSTYFGGSSGDGGSGIKVDLMGNAYVAGGTVSTNFPTRNALQTNYGGGDAFNGDAFVTKINPSGQQLVFSTYLGGNQGEAGLGIAIDSAGNAYIAGQSRSTNFPTINALQPNYAGGSAFVGDAFVTKISGFAINSATQFDYDGDGRADESVFRPSDGVWYVLGSTRGFSAAQFGLPTDKIVPADFDGDGRTDIAVFRNGVWYWLNSSNNTFNAAQFGQAGDLPVPADYTGDGRAELAVYRTGVWYVLNLANNQFQATQFGGGADITTPADFDGDGKADIAVYRPSNGTWYWLQSSNGASQSLAFGTAATPVIGDYDGDGRADPAVYLEGRWYIARSSAGFTIVPFGITSDRPVPADYDGDGKTDIAVYRDGVWYQLRSEQGFGAVQFGTTSDQPTPAAFVP